MMNKMIIKLRAKKCGYPLLKVSNDAINEYRKISDAKGYKLDDFDIVKIISRDWHVGVFKSACGYLIYKAYGNLDLVYDYYEGAIVSITNHKEKARRNYINMAEKRFITELYQIPAYEKVGGRNE